MIESLKSDSADSALSLRDKLRVAQKTFRLMVANTVGLVTDALTPISVEEQEGSLAHLSGRAEIRDDAGAIHMSRYILQNEIGSEGFRESVDADFTKTLS